MTQVVETTFNLVKPLKEDYGTLKNFIDGEWVAPQTERFLDVTDPASGKVIAKVPLSATADVDRALDAANEALCDWRFAPPIVRATCPHERI
jgi:malonate-semialdehyde dehydrogenase (acetylating) / methylmalonate-semialdehyde dehydrogenase